MILSASEARCNCLQVHIPWKVGLGDAGQYPTLAGVQQCIDQAAMACGRGGACTQGLQPMNTVITAPADLISSQLDP
jgi:hypothetical protein